MKFTIDTICCESPIDTGKSEFSVEQNHEYRVIKLGPTVRLIGNRGYDHEGDFRYSTCVMRLRRQVCLACL